MLKKRYYEFHPKQPEQIPDYIYPGSTYARENQPQTYYLDRGDRSVALFYLFRRKWPRNKLMDIVDELIDHRESLLPRYTKQTGWIIQFHDKSSNNWYDCNPDNFLDDTPGYDYDIGFHSIEEGIEVLGIIRDKSNIPLRLVMVAVETTRILAVYDEVVQ